MKVKWCDRALIISPYCFGLATTEKAFNEELKRLNLAKPWPLFLATEHADASTHYLEASNGKRIALVTLRASKKQTKAQIAALLVHEAMHIWRAIREHIGETAPSSEFEAYSMQHISQQLMLAYESSLKRT